MLTADVIRSEFDKAATAMMSRATLYQNGNEALEEILKLATHLNLYAIFRQEVIDDFFETNIARNTHNVRIFDALCDLNMQFEFGLNLHADSGRGARSVLEGSAAALGCNVFPSGSVVHDQGLAESLTTVADALKFLQNYPWLRALVYLRLFYTPQLVASAGDQTAPGRE